MFKALKIKATGEEFQIEQKLDFDFKDYERELGTIESLENFPAIYDGKTAMIMTSRFNDDKSIPINDKASSYYQKFLDLEETPYVKEAIPNVKNIKSSNTITKGLYIRGDCVMVLKSAGVQSIVKKED